VSRTVIVGDIHGCYDELIELLAKADLRPEDLLISVGDVVDRGPAPAEVVRFLRDRPNSVVVMGNHERKHVRGIFSYAQEITRLQLGTGYAEAVEWMRTLPYYYENEHVRVVHAALLPGVALADQPEDILCGTTSGERALAARLPDGHWHEHYTDAKPVAFGHHVAGRDPLLRDGVVFGLDTGACHGWNLTALSLPDRTIHSVEAHADHWAIAKLHWQLPVLKTRPWPDYTWPDLAEAIATSAPRPDPATQAWLAAMADWSATLRAMLPGMTAAAHRAAAELSPTELREHRAAPLLFQARNGRLDEAALARRCPTPRRLTAQAEALGLTPPPPPT
jgi:serine/threonine protein phosphatase 1